jgi:hypothetical protein
MKLKPITVIVVFLFLVVSVSIAGCAFFLSPSSSPADYSSYFNTWYSNGTSRIKQPFTKGTNERGDTVYTGVTRNSSEVGNYQYTVVIGPTLTQTDATRLYDQTVGQKLGEGFIAQPDWAASYKAAFPYNIEVWAGQMGDQDFYVMYYYDSNVSPSWLFVTAAGGAGG